MSIDPLLFIGGVKALREATGSLARLGEVAGESFAAILQRVHPETTQAAGTDVELDAEPSEAAATGLGQTSELQVAFRELSQFLARFGVNPEDIEFVQNSAGEINGTTGNSLADPILQAWLEANPQFRSEIQSLLSQPTQPDRRELYPT